MINLPIQVNMTLDQSKTVFALALESNIEEVMLSNDTVINATIIDVPQYEGPYTVDPLAKSDIVLETKDKMCHEDITVKKIKTSETINPAGGYTLYIAEME